MPLNRSIAPINIYYQKEREKEVVEMEIQRYIDIYIQKDRWVDKQTDYKIDKKMAKRKIRVNRHINIVQNQID